MQKISFQTQDNFKLSGRLASPELGHKKYPAVLILEGSGQSPENKRSENDSFIQLLNKISGNEMIGLHYGKRGSGENFGNGVYLESSFEDHIGDAFSAIEYIKSLPNVDQNKIFVMGQSMGGHLATQIALKENIAGLILYTTPVKPLREFMVEQNKLILKYLGKNQDEINEYVTGLARDIAAMENSSYVCEAPSCEVINGHRVYEGSESVKFLEQIARSNQIEHLKGVKAPTLIIHGTSDFVIPASDSELAYEVLKESNSEVSLEIIKDLDHFFASNPSKEESFNYVIEAQKSKAYQDVNKTLVEKLINWLNEKKIN